MYAYLAFYYYHQHGKMHLVYLAFYSTITKRRNALLSLTNERYAMSIFKTAKHTDTQEHISNLSNTLWYQNTEQ